MLTLTKNCAVKTGQPPERQRYSNMVEDFKGLMLNVGWEMLDDKCEVMGHRCYVIDVGC